MTHHGCGDPVADQVQGGGLARGQAVAVGQPHQPRIVGELDPKQKLTFDLVRQLRETDAAELMRDHGESEKTTVQTAWNNRLASLANLGLVVEMSQGRSKRYRPLFAEE